MARKKFQPLKKRSFDLLSFEGKRIHVGAKKPKLRRFEIRAFCDKMRSFCTISASTFWKIQPYIQIYIYIQFLSDKFSQNRSKY